MTRSSSKQMISCCTKEWIPHKKIGSRHNLPYITPAIKRKIRKRQRVFNRTKKRNRPNDWYLCIELKREIKLDLAIAFNNYINQLLGPEEKPGMMKRFYSYIKSLRQDSFGVSTLRAKGRVAATAEEKANMCNQQFHSVFTPPSDPDSDQPAPGGPRLPTLPRIEITVNGIEKRFKSLDPSKATGPDGIPARFLKECAVEIAPAIAQFYQQSLDEGTVPDEWRQQNVHPIFKKGSKADPANYRPVALTAILCKQLEHCFSSALHTHLDNHKWLQTYQHGFRKNLSTVTQLLTAITDLFWAMSRGEITDSIIVDFSKAFDKVDLELLLHKLDHIGVKSNQLDWMRSFLTNRSQTVVIDGVASETCEVTSGVPQGSVLGPLLFIVYINDIGEQLSPGTFIRLFADDALIYRRINSFADHITLQNDIHTLMAWADVWKMDFNPSKCYAMHFLTPHQKRTTCAAPYYMGQHQLERVSDTKYLGVTMNEHLSWSTHTTNSAAKAHASLSFMERNLRFVPQKLRERAYFTIVRPAFEYASEITDPYLGYDITKLDNVQRHAARFVTNTPRKRYDPDEDPDSVSALLADLKWEPLATRRRDARCTFMYKLLHNLVDVDDGLRPHYTSEYFRAGKKKELKRIPSSKKKSEPYHFSFFPRTVRDWNRHVPVPARQAEDLDGFKAAFRH